MNRRSFIAAAPALVGAAAGFHLVGCKQSEVTSGNPNALLAGPIGVQLYTLRSLMRDDFDGVLAKVAEIGFKEVEFAGYYDRQPAALRAQLDGLGLRAPSSHIPLTTIESDLAGTIETAKTLGHEYIICPFLDNQQRQGGVARYQALAETFNRAGETCKAAGIRFGYHNHDFEFAKDGDRVLFDVLLDETDPELVTIELDLYWIVQAGADPLTYFERYPGRFELFHVKDRAAEGGMRPVGQGTIDFAGIFAADERAGTRHYFVEHDNPEDPLASITASFRHLKGMTSR
ncbi:MAG TPA: sugar phosphate isomerase/epimerase [Rhodothermales bacterium]